jgi:hypothetical protein
MSWKHEWPLEEEAANDPAPIPANPLINGTDGVEEAPTRIVFESLSPAASNDRQISGIMNTFQQEPSAEVSSARLENGDVERSPSASSAPRPGTGKHCSGIECQQKKRRISSQIRLSVE